MSFYDLWTLFLFILQKKRRKEKQNISTKEKRNKNLNEEESQFFSRSVFFFFCKFHCGLNPMRLYHDNILFYHKHDGIYTHSVHCLLFCYINISWSCAIYTQYPLAITQHTHGLLVPLLYDIPKRNKKNFWTVVRKEKKYLQYCTYIYLYTYTFVSNEQNYVPQQQEGSFDVIKWNLYKYLCIFYIRLAYITFWTFFFVYLINWNERWKKKTQKIIKN